jgi:hypothetical protein
MFFQTGTYEIQKGINIKLESLIGMVLHIGKFILGEFGSDPEKCGIKDMYHLLNFKDRVLDEASAFLENYKNLKEVFEFLKNAISAYVIMNTNYDRKSSNLRKTKIFIDLLDKTRFFINEITQRF